jgi:spore coat polysaccharide biosynthesis protein SpsF
MSSERLPGKVLVELDGAPVIEHVVRAIRASHLVDDLVVATSTDSADDVLADTVVGLGVRVHRGPLGDVLTRFTGVLAEDDADVVVRHTADDPLLDPDVIDVVVASFIGSDDTYVSNIIDRSWPRGLDTEVMSRDALMRCDELATDQRYREHVTLFARTHPEMFPQHNVAAPPDQHWPELRLCLDTEEDLVMLTEVFAALHRPGRPLEIGAVIDFLRARPDVASMNAHIQQRSVFGREY